MTSKSASSSGVDSGLHGRRFSLGHARKQQTRQKDHATTVMIGRINILCYACVTYCDSAKRLILFYLFNFFLCLCVVHILPFFLFPFWGLGVYRCHELIKVIFCKSSIASM